MKDKVNILLIQTFLFNKSYNYKLLKMIKEYEVRNILKMIKEYKLFNKTYILKFC